MKHLAGLHRIGRTDVEMGIREDRFSFASDIYGLVGDCDFRRDGRVALAVRPSGHCPQHKQQEAQRHNYAEPDYGDIEDTFAP